MSRNTIKTHKNARYKRSSVAEALEAAPARRQWISTRADGVADTRKPTIIPRSAPRSATAMGLE
jgi:hypothetical protein